MEGGFVYVDFVEGLIVFCIGIVLFDDDGMRWNRFFDDG